MPVDKFGRHLYSHEEPQIFLAEAGELSELKSVSVLPIIGIRTDSDGYFILSGDQVIAGKRVYLCPVTGTITDVRLSVKEVTIYINDKVITPTSLIGLNLRNGDHISIHWSTQNNQNRQQSLVLTIVVLSPLHFT